MKNRFVGLFLSGVLLLLLGACSGGDTQVADEGGIGGTGRAYGKITNFGSIFVNGVEYETETAEVTVNGTSANGDSDLGVGMVVTVEGSVNADGVTGTATKVLYERELKGPVTAVFDSVNGTLGVLGQTVHVMGSTIYENSTATGVLLSGLTTNHLVEVSGYSSGDGAIYATRIELKDEAWDPGEEMEVKGIVASQGDGSFLIGGLPVHYGVDTQLDGLSAVTDGLYVQVKGQYTGVVLEARVIELEGDGSKGISGAEGEELELEGVLTSALNGDLFGVNGQTVRLASDTQFENGTNADLATVGTVLEVEGRFDANGVLVAEEIEFEAEGQYEFEGYVESVEATAGTFSLFGQSIGVTPSTIMVDDTPNQVRSFTLANLQIGDRVEVYLAVDAQSNLVATKLVREVDEEPGEWEIKGPFESGETPDTVIIAGVTVDVVGVEGPQEGETAELSGSYDYETYTPETALIATPD